MPNRRPLLAVVLVALLAPAVPLLAVPDGAPDLDFGGGDGIASWTGGGKVTVHDVATTDSLVIGIGSFEPTAGPPWRLHWQGFDIDGNLVVTKSCYATPGSLVPFAVETQGLAAIVDSSHNLLVGGSITFQGTESQERALLQRFDLSATTCTLDDTFSGNGWDVEDDQTWCDTEDCAVVGLEEIRRETLAAGAPRIVALVRSTVNFLVSRFFLLGLHLDGSIDTGFGTGGWVEVTKPAYDSLASAVAMSQDAAGRIYVLVSYYDEGQPDLDVQLMRFSADGVIDDSSWRIADSGDPGIDTAEELAEALAFTSSGPVVTAHQGADGNVVQELDLTSGYLVDSTHSTPAWRSTSLVAQGNGRYLEAHDLEQASDTIRLRRRLDGAPPADYDSAFGSAGAVSIDVDLGGDHPQSLARLRLWHGMPIVAGTAITNDGDPAGFIARAVNRYIFADAFDGGSFSAWSFAPTPKPPEP